MNSFWIAVYLMAASLAIVQVVLVGLQTWEHRRFARSRMKALPWCRASGRAVLFVPCRGGDVGLEQNLHHLMVQDYDDYEVRFVIEGPEDPVWPVIRRVTSQHMNVPARVVFSGQSTISGQKVHNLRVGAADVEPEVEYLAFVDADARPASDWLRALLSRLDMPGVGASTGYRWFVPKEFSLANLLAYSINCNIANLLGSKGPNMVWGGSWAIRRSTFERVELAQAWKGTVSDDLVASRVLRQNGYRVEFEPAAMVQSPVDYRFGEMFAFLRRQNIMGRIYTPWFWTFGLVMTTFATAMLLGSLGAAVFGWAQNAPTAWLPAGVFGLLYASGVFRGIVRQSAVSVYFPELGDTLQKAQRFDAWAGPLFGLVNWLTMVAASVGQHITWRGITYRLYRGGQIRRVLRDDEPDMPRPEESLSSDADVRSPARYRKAG